MGAQRQLLGALGSLLSAVGVATSAVKKARQKQALAKEKASKKAEKASKQSYEKEANIKQENKQIVNNIAKPEVGVFGIENIIAEQQETAPQQKQKFVLSEEGATYPITAENSQTNIPVDEDIKTLISVKEKSAKRAAAGLTTMNKRKEAYTRMQQISGDPNVKPEDYEFKWDITDSELKKAGYTKTDIKELAVRASFEPSKVADELGISDQKSDWTKDDIEAALKEKIRPIKEIDEENIPELTKEEKQDAAISEWYENFDRNNYKVWDKPEETELNNDRSFSDIVF